mgnify:CR=1 FL=1
MEDVEYVTERNHRAARERELGKRWNEIVRLRKKQSELLKIAETTCFSIACMMVGGSAVLLGLGLYQAAFTLFGLAVIGFVGAVITGT